MSEELDLKAYSGYYYDEDTLKRSASGGLSTALGEAVIRRGGLVFGVSYTDDFKGAEYRCADTIEKLRPLHGSKYIETIPQIRIEGQYRNVYAVVGEELKSDREILFIGLGCNVAALYNYLDHQKIGTRNLFTAELICQGPTVRKVAEDYIDRLERRYKSSICAFSVRYKKEGWTPPYIHAEFINGNVHEEPFYESDYGYAFSLYTREGCFSCRFKGANHRADLVLGDYWGLDPSEPGFNKNGVSVVVIRTEKGRELISYIDRTAFKIDITDVNKAIAGNPRYSTPAERGEKWVLFDRNFRNTDLHTAAMKTEGIMKYEIKYILRKAHLLSFVRKIKSRL